MSPPKKTATPSAFEAAARRAGLPVEPGKGALLRHDKEVLGAKHTKTKFTASVNIDAAFLASEPNHCRWDYGVGIKPDGENEFALWVEPHPASSTGEVKKLLAKLDWLQAKLDRPEFEPLKALTAECARQGHHRFHWVSPSHVSIRPGSPEANMLAKRGLGMPTKRVVI
jgi:hypothetical protein